LSSFEGKATESTATADAPVDWSKLKAEVVARLDVGAEYAELGVEFTRGVADAKGHRECRAIGRPDLSPSAFVNVETGVYVDSGGEGEKCHLFDFAVRHGGARFGRFIDAARFYAEKARIAIGPVQFKSKGRLHEARYTYRDADEVPRYAVFRSILPNGKKTFTQHPVDAAGEVTKHGAGAMDGIEPLPYRLPELLASDPEDPVWVVEGEKAADALTTLGLAATTNHGGSKVTDKTWPKFLGHFAGRDCLVLPDNDAAGRGHAAKVCGHLAGVARSIKLLELPGLPAKGDVVDWLAEGGTIEELGRLAHASPAWTPGGADATEVEDDPANRDATVADLRRSLSDEAWLWPGWIPAGALTLLASDPGIGKTRFCFDLHRRLYNGYPWPDGTVTTNISDQPRFLWVVADDQYREMCEIPDAFGIPDECIFVNAMASDPFSGTSLQTAEELADLEERIARIRPTLVLIDTITNTSDAKSQDSSDAKKQYKPLQGIATRCQVPILCVTHLNSGGKVLGRRAVEKVRVVIQLEQPDPESQEHRRKLWVSKTKALKPPALGITMGECGNEYDTKPPEKPEEGRVEGHKKGPVPTKLRDCMDWLATRINGQPVRVSQLRDAAETEGFGSTILYRAKDQLGIIETLGEPGGATGKRYKLWSQPPDPGAINPPF
jgi:putative DNA primase/helicase